MRATGPQISRYCMIERQRPQLALTITSHIQQSIVFMNKCFDSGFRFGIYDLCPIGSCRREVLTVRRIQIKGDTTMKNAKKIAVSLLILGVMTGFTQAATHHESKSDATLRLSGGSFALGIGVNWGSGTLTYKGKAYPDKIKGQSRCKGGMTTSTANGQFFSWTNLQYCN